jgi:hypothetical protein
MIRTLTLLTLLLGLTAALPSTAHATSGADYLASRLTLSGGFAEAGTSSPSVSLTEWSVMGLTAAGRHPATMHRTGGHTPAAFLAAHVGQWDTALELERGILAVVAMGRSPASFGGRNLVAALRSRIVSGSGRIGSQLNSTYWGVLALKAAASPVPWKTGPYIRSHQLPSGGYSWGVSAGPDSNDTAAAVLALRLVATPCAWKAVHHAYDYLNTLHHSDGGYALTQTAASDSQSTSWVIQARIRCSLSNTGALAYLAARHLPSGAYNYQQGRGLTPVWVTSQVLPAVNHRPYPVRP